MKLGLHPDARAELEEAADWYDLEQTGLGDALVADVDETLRRIADAPGAFPRWPGTEGVSTPIRRALLGRFPYAIAYVADGDALFVVAIAHAKRRPLYWLTRAP